MKSFDLFLREVEQDLAQFEVSVSEHMRFILESYQSSLRAFEVSYSILVSESVEKALSLNL